MTEPFAFDPAIPYRGAARSDTAPGPADEPDAVSPGALERLLASGRRVGGIVGERAVATAIPFNARLARDVVRSSDIAAHRRRLDRALAHWASTLFATARPLILLAAGQWWYPPGTWFGCPSNEAYHGWSLREAAVTRVKHLLGR